MLSQNTSPVVRVTDKSRGVLSQARVPIGIPYPGLRQGFFADLGVNQSNTAPSEAGAAESSAVHTLRVDQNIVKIDKGLAAALVILDGT